MFRARCFLAWVLVMLLLSQGLYVWALYHMYLELSWPSLLVGIVGQFFVWWPIGQLLAHHMCAVPINLLAPMFNQSARCMIYVTSVPVFALALLVSLLVVCDGSSSSPRYCYIDDMKHQRPSTSSFEMLVFLSYCQLLYWMHIMLDIVCPDTMWVPANRFVRHFYSFSFHTVCSPLHLQHVVESTRLTADLARTIHDYDACRTEEKQDVETFRIDLDKVTT